MISAHADLTVQDVNAALTDAGEPVETAQLVVHVPEQESASVTEIVLERNAEMTDVTLEISVTFVVPNKSVELTLDVLEHAHLTAETPMVPKEFVVTTDALVLAENVLKFQDKTSDAEMVNVYADLNVMLTRVDPTDADQLVEHVKEMLNVLTEPVFTQSKVAVEMVFANLH
jgi:hypothetical protein